MLVKELVAERKRLTVKCIGPEATLHEMASRLQKHDIGALLVTDDRGGIAGLVSERDLTRAFASCADAMGGYTVADIMSAPVVSCGLRDDVVEMLALMNLKHIRHIPVIEAGEPVAMLSIRDFDKACDRLLSQALTDELTGLPNRRHFLQLLHREQERNQRLSSPFAVAVLDLDHFKQINDRHGHEAGNRALQSLAGILTSSLRPYDFAGRLGGEEFGIVFPGTEVDQAAQVCLRLLSRIRESSVMAGKEEIRFTASAGLTSSGYGARDCAAMLQRADRLLYQAKSDGRDTLVTEAQISSISKFRARHVASARSAPPE